MKKALPLFGLLLLCACSSDPNMRHVTSAGNYSNKDAHMSMSFPKGWEVKIIDEVPNQYKVERMFGKEGGVQVTWGQKVGGVCIENGKKKEMESMKISGRDMQVCHTVNDDGTENWKLISWGDLKTGGSIDAYANKPSAENRQMVLDALESVRISQ